MCYTPLLEILYLYTSAHNTHTHIQKDLDVHIDRQTQIDRSIDRSVGRYIDI